MGNNRITAKAFIVAGNFGEPPNLKLFVHRVIALDGTAAAAICCTQWGRMTDQPLTGIAMQEIDEAFLQAAMDALRGRAPGVGANVVSLVKSEPQPGDDGAALPEPKMADIHPHGFFPYEHDQTICDFCRAPADDPIHTGAA